MGSGNCCKTKKNDKDFDVENIIKLENYKKATSNKHSNENSFTEFNLNKELENKKIESIVQNFDCSLISNNNNIQNSINNYKKEKPNLEMMKLVRHATFQNNSPRFTTKFIQNLNEARTDFLGFSKKLLDFSQNFYFIQNKIDQINQEGFKKIFSRTKEDFKKTSEFFVKLHEEKIKEEKENLNELIEVEEFKLPIPLNVREVKTEKYLEKFRKRFFYKYSEKFKLERIRIEIVHFDPEISFLLFVTKNIQKIDFFFEKELKYIGVDFQENGETVLLTITLSSDL